MPLSLRHLVFDAPIQKSPPKKKFALIDRRAAGRAACARPVSPPAARMAPRDGASAAAGAGTKRSRRGDNALVMQVRRAARARHSCLSKRRASAALPGPRYQVARCL
jgi:hypothetical protein